MIYDTDILIWVQRGNEKAAALIEKDEEKYLSIQSYMGDVIILDIARLYRQSKRIAIDEQTDDDIVHLRGFGEADRFARQAFNAGA